MFLGISSKIESAKRAMEMQKQPRYLGTKSVIDASALDGERDCMMKNTQLKIFQDFAILIIMNKSIKLKNK